MATIKVKFRKSAVNGKAGTVYYQLCHEQKNRQITTRIHILPEYWDNESGQIKASSDNRTMSACRNRIESDVAHLRRIIRDLDNGGKPYMLCEIIEMFRSAELQITVFSYMKGEIEQLKSNKRLGTARSYQRTLSSFSAFLNGKDLSFTVLSEETVMSYNDWLLERGVVRNTISFYMRVLRSVYNKAVRQHIAEQTQPFQNVYTGVDRTRKRAVHEDIVLQLQKLDLSHNSSLSLTRDLFVFSYCTRGMAFVDMAYLRKEDIGNGMISYTRRKTGQRLSIHMEPCMEAIIRRYTLLVTESRYVFPIIGSDDIEQAFLQYETALGQYNKKLKKIAKLIGKALPLTSYTSRHTWATTARNHNVPISIISEGMGHTSESTTRIYLASLDNSAIDQANRRLLRDFNKTVRL